MELKLTRETLRFERLVNRGEEQVTIEGEATLPGSMRDAVTVLSVQAQTHLNDAQAGNGEAGVRGRVCFQVLYTQGDLTRVRALETSCDFTHTMPLSGVTPAMRVSASAAVQETEGTATSGRMTLRALLGIQTEAFETIERELVTRAEDAGGEAELQTRMQTVAFCVGETLGENKTLVREEFDLPAKLEVGDVLSATASATAGELSGGNGRIGVSGTIEVRALHRPKEPGNPMVSTVHELPFDLTIDTPQLEDGAQPQAEAEVIDVMADSVESDKSRTLRVEAEVRVRLRQCRQRQTELLEDLYSLCGPALEPMTETLDVHTFEENADVRESTRLQVAMPKDAPPIGTVLASFVQPTITAVMPSGRRLDAEGVMGVTILYLPMDSDIPVSVRTREPFMMTFPVEAAEDVRVQAYPIETATGPTTSDRAELRCVLGLRARQHGVRRIRGVTDVIEHPQERQERGFVLVWPAAGETRWDTARRLRVAESELRPAGKSALLAFRR
ncbi:MAG: DUF3794 domain-containing protein [Candidatus Ventricola sp.]